MCKVGFVMLPSYQAMGFAVITSFELAICKARLVGRTKKHFVDRTTQPAA
jgi:hypothetical protein